jgi:hypothetical protein
MEPKFYIIQNHQYYPDFGLGDWYGPYYRTEALEKFDEACTIGRDKSISLVEVSNNEIKIIGDKRI